MIPPPITIHKNEIRAFSTTKLPVCTATKAKLKVISEEASFSKLSPSKMVETLLGTFTCCMMVVALTASVGAKIPPNIIPIANVMPGTIQVESKPTPTAVRNTTRKAKERITRFQLNTSLSGNVIADIYSNGGKKM